MKKTVLYLGLPYHQKTKSHMFILEQLKQQYSVSEVYHDFFANQECEIDFCTQYDYLICWQVMPMRDFLEKIEYRKGILFPMFDAVVNTSKSRWMDFSDFIVINFSKTLHDKLISYGITSHYVQYFPKIEEVSCWGRKDSLFFWQRVHEININLILGISQNLKLKHVHIHKALDPERFFIAPKEEYNYNYTYSNWFPQKADMKNTILESALYVAPRRYEGIGMSFLEAMALGRCVIAPDCPTMNEYIINGVNGILYDINKPEMISPMNILAIQKNTYNFMRNGYEKWEKERKNIIQWIEKSKPGKYRPESEKQLSNVNGLVDLKFKSYFHLLNHMLIIKNTGKSIANFLESQGISKIALYGYGQVAMRLMEELESSNVEVSYVIDKNKNIQDGNIKVCNLDEEWSKVDAIIITPVYIKDEITTELKKKTDMPLYSLDVILSFLIQYC